MCRLVTSSHLVRGLGEKIMSNDQADGTSRDPKHDALHAEWLNHQRSCEKREAEHHETLDR